MHSQTLSEHSNTIPEHSSTITEIGLVCVKILSSFGPCRRRSMH